MSSWKQVLAGQMPLDWAGEIDQFEAQIALRKQGKVEEKLFAETRLRRGAYGQRYDNGKRHDGTKTQDLPYPSGALTKGPETLWDAPGMQRIKIPYGGLNPAQMRVMADLAEEYSDGIAHVTTRQDFQLHFIHIDDTPDIMRRLAAVGITTREACGNSVRNITACPRAGCCKTEAFDVTPYSKSMMKFLLGHRDTMDFGRKFKIAFSGCREEACGLLTIHDLGFLAVKRGEQRGFEVYVGGGLGAVPNQAKLLYDFVPHDQILQISQAISRVFGRLGEKKQRNKARIKFLVKKLGIEEFRKLIDEELKTIPHDERFDTIVGEAEAWRETAGTSSVATAATNGHADAEYSNWLKTNVYAQRQNGYHIVTVTLPLGDISSDQLRALADLTHKYAGDNARTTVEQNIVLRWVATIDLPSLYAELKALGLGQSGAGTIVDVVACPGTDTCKLGIASSRGLAGELRERLLVQQTKLDQAIKDLRIKISGCFNSCGQHHIADIGFYGNSRNIGGYTVPHFQVVLGGKWRDNGGSYGLAIGSVPSKRIPDLVEALAARYVGERSDSETFQDYTTRLGKKALKEIVDQFTPVPSHDEKPEFYSDWGDPREFTIGDMGMGECAGEIVNSAHFGFSEAESSAFEAHLALESGDYRKADDFAYRAMLKAAETLVRQENRDVSAQPDAIADEFRTRFMDTQRFFDRFARDQFGNYFLNRHAGGPVAANAEAVHQLIEEAQLFIDAAHACHMRMQQEVPVGLSIAGAK
jgi:sulfite reductase (ferredoxin)